MGTRHLVCVVKGGKYKVAQYGQWDGYPSECGVNVLKFILSLDTAAKWKEFKKVIGKVRILKGGKRLSEEYQALGICDKKGEFIDKTFEDNKVKYPWITRDTSYGVLPSIMLTDTTPILKNEVDFAGDSLFCEWAYVIDLDKQSFEVYKGFNERPLPAGARFESLKRSKEDGEYYQVRLFKWWSLNTLPTLDQFLDSCSAKEGLMDEEYDKVKSTNTDEYYRIWDSNLVDGMETQPKEPKESTKSPDLGPRKTPEELEAEYQSIVNEATKYPEIE